MSKKTLRQMNRALSVDCTKKLHVCTRHTGKMKGMWSISTSPLSNEGCKVRSQIEGSVCARCYARGMCAQYKDLAPCLDRNGSILSTRDIDPVAEMPYLGNLKYFRFESFGDLINPQHLKNYLAIARANPTVKFALWTKALEVGDEVFIKQKVKCPKNLTILVSSLFINKEIAKPSWAHKIFTVYSKEYIEEHGIEINCGARNCVDCHRCYQRSGDTIINEKLK